MTRTKSTTNTDDYGYNTDEVIDFLSAIETLTTDQLTRAEAACGTDDPEWERAWEVARTLAVWLCHGKDFRAAIDAAWEHAAKRADFERWDHVWEHAACHTAAALVIGHRLPAPMFNRLTSAFIAAGVITAKPVPSS